MTGRTICLMLVAGVLAAAGCNRVITAVPQAGEAAAAQLALAVVRAQSPDDARELAPPPAAEPASAAPAQPPREAPATAAKPSEPAKPPAPPVVPTAAEELSKLLSPPARLVPRPSELAGAAPRAVPGPARLENPPPWLPPSPGGLPRLPAVRLRVPPRPWPAAEGPPLADQRSTPRPAAEIVLEAGERVRIAGLDPAAPTPLPPTTQPVPDRTAAEDPTAEFSLAAARAAVPPDRFAKAPFVPLSLPDPFELRKTVQLKSPPPDDGDPVTAVARPPIK